MHWGQQQHSKLVTGVAKYWPLDGVSFPWATSVLWQWWPTLTGSEIPGLSWTVWLQWQREYRMATLNSLYGGAHGLQRSDRCR